MFDEITASSLVKMDLDGNVIGDAGKFNNAGFIIHSGVYKARPDANVVMHTHTRAGAGLSPHEAAKLARSTIIGAALLMARPGSDPAELRRQVTSPGGTTEAALNVLLGEKGLPSLLRDAVGQAVRRSKALGG